MGKIARIFILIFVGFFSFLFFLYFSFPYEVLKESIAVHLSQETGINMNLGEMKPKLPLGVSFKRIQVTTPSGTSLFLKSATVKVSLLKALIGKVGIGVEITDDKAGVLEFQTDFGIISLITDPAPFPSYMNITASKFKIDQIVNFALKRQEESEETNVLIKPLLKSFRIEGMMNANVDLTIDIKDQNRSEGEAQISFDQMKLLISDSSISIPDQIFDKAQIVANLKDGQLRFDPSSKITSNNIAIAIGGQIIQKADIKLDLLINLQLKNELESQFGWVLDAAANKKTNGSMEIHIGGDLTSGSKVKIL